MHSLRLLLTLLLLLAAAQAAASSSEDCDDIAEAADTYAELANLFDAFEDVELDDADMRDLRQTTADVSQLAKELNAEAGGDSELRRVATNLRRAGKTLDASLSGNDLDRLIAATDELVDALDQLTDWCDREAAAPTRTLTRAAPKRAAPKQAAKPPAPAAAPKPTAAPAAQPTATAKPAAAPTQAATPDVAAAAPTAPAADFATDLLREHNRVRAAVGVAPLAWSPTLATFAQEWAATLASQGCALNHRQQDRYGENLASFGGTAPAGAAVRSWEEERPLYDGGPMNDRNFAAGHYTQVVWRSSTSVGCGQATCGDATVVVCNYEPAGNTNGERAY